MPETIAALVIFLFPLAYSPGPGNLFFAANGARFGFRATIPANLGYHLATWCVTLAVGFGFAAILTRFPQVFALLKVVGSLYVLWLAYKMMRAGAIDQQEAAAARFRSNDSGRLLNAVFGVVLAGVAFWMLLS